MRSVAKKTSNLEEKVKEVSFQINFQKTLLSGSGLMGKLGE